MHVFALLVFCCLSGISADFSKCPNGSPIYREGITQTEKQVIIDLHNNYRMEVANGLVEGQPRAVNLKKMGWDNTLAKLSEAVTKECKKEHVLERDPRFGIVGQNIYISMNSSDDGGIPDWKTIMHQWFNEFTSYKFGGFSGAAGHYTQLIWADTHLIGCDFIYFKSVQPSKVPYTKIYTCNYGPPGNIYGSPPYQTGQSGCEKLC